MVKIGYIINTDVLFGLLKISNDDILRDVSKGFNRRYVENFLIENALYELLQFEYSGKIIKIDFITFSQLGKIILYMDINENGINHDEYIEKLHSIKKDIEGQINMLSEKLNIDVAPLIGVLKVIN